jgi:hypothetical protein
MCRFGEVNQPATHLSNSEIRCLSPRGRPGYVAVEVSLNFQDWSTSGVLFQYQLVSVTRAMPGHTSQLGGEEIVVHGTNFMPPNEGSLYCVFGNPMVEPAVLAHWESSRILRCEAPPTRQKGAVPVSIMHKDTLYTSSSVIVFSERPEVLTLHPSRGPVRGGTVVTVTGNNLASTTTDRCYFGSIMTMPRIWSKSRIECISPPVLGSRMVQVTINQDSVAAPLRFRYYDEPTVRAIKPNQGPIGGGSYVEIYGRNFDFASAQAGETFCRFNTTTVPATFVSSTLLQCVAPRHSEGYVDIEVAMQLQDFSSSGVQFQFQKVELAAIYPMRGPVAGNTTVIISATNVAPPCFNCLINKDLWCMFGHMPKVPAFFDSPNQISCLAPGSFAPGIVSVSVMNADAIYESSVAFLYEGTPSAAQIFPLTGPVLGGTKIVLQGEALSAQVSTFCRFDSLPVPAHYVTTDRIECVTPAHPAGYAALLLTTNDQNYFDDGLQFEYQPLHQVLQIAPNHGPVAGGTLIVLIGSDFSQRSVLLEYLHCRFNQTLVPATYLSPTELLCVTPEHTEAVSSVEVTMNLQQFSDSGMLFEYYRVRLHHVAPLSGPMAGGTELIVSGEGFQPASYKGMWCWFAEAQRTEATYESSVEVRCKSPSSGLAKVVDVKIQVDEAFLEGAV